RKRTRYDAPVSVPPAQTPPSARSTAEEAGGTGGIPRPMYEQVLPRLSEEAGAALSRWRGDARSRDAWPELDARVQAALAGDGEALAELEDAFCQTLPIGTGGRRGRVGPGPNRVNEVVMRDTARGLADFVRRRGLPRKVVVVFDTRRDSREFAEIVADAL